MFVFTFPINILRISFYQHMNSRFLRSLWVWIHISDEITEMQRIRREIKMI